MIRYIYIYMYIYIYIYISLRSSAQAQLLVPVHGLLSDSTTPSLWLIRRLGMVSRLRCI